MISRILPNEVRLCCLKFLADSILLAHEAGPSRWGATCRNTLQLKVGQSVVLTISKETIRLIAHSPKKPEELKAIGEVCWCPTKDKFYKTSQGSYECIFPVQLASKVLPHVRRSHSLWIKEAARTPYSYKGHSQELIEYLSTEFGHAFPSPLSHPCKAPESEDSEDTVSHVPSDEQHIEGLARTFTVSAYERDLVVRRKCIMHHGDRCAVCGMTFRDVYGGSFAGFIHVHHLMPLSEVGAEHEVDPIRDLRPVCPNCHAVIHLKKNGVFSIEEVRMLVSKAASH